MNTKSIQEKGEHVFREGEPYILELKINTHKRVRNFY